MNVISRVLLSSFVLIAFSSIAQADARFWGNHNKPKHSGNSNWNQVRQEDSYARTNPHYGQVDSDGILSPGEIRNPLINYNVVNYNNYNNNYYNYRHPDYNNNHSIQDNNWQNYWNRKPCDQKHSYQNQGSILRWPQAPKYPYKDWRGNRR